MEALEALDSKNMIPRTVYTVTVEWKPWGMETQVRHGWIGEPALCVFQSPWTFFQRQ